MQGINNWKIFEELYIGEYIMQETIIEILKKYTFDNKVWENFNENMDLKDDLKINSARVVDIVLDLEEKFDIEISDEDIEKMKTVKDVMEIVGKKM
jgi:acyl carrier protein